MQQLFDVQDLDTLLAQLRHRYESLPERANIAAGEKVIASGEARIASVRAQRHDLAREQKRVDDDIEMIEAKVAAENTKLYSGTVTAVKELQSLQDEIAALGRRLSDLEDIALDLMEQAEPIDERLAELDSERDKVVAALDELRAVLAGVEVELTSEIDDAEQRRDVAAAQLPPDVLARYEQARVSFGSRSVVHFSGTDCTGCPMSMPAMEVDRVKHAPEGSLLTCTECGRIVAR